MVLTFNLLLSSAAVHYGKLPIACHFISEEQKNKDKK